MDTKGSCTSCQSCGHGALPPGAASGPPSAPPSRASPTPPSRASPPPQQGRSCRRVCLSLGLGVVMLLVISQYSAGSYLTSKMNRRPKMKSVRKLQWDSDQPDDTNTSLALCPLKPPGLVGHIPVAEISPEWPELRQKLSNVLPGGRWRPQGCLSREKLALVVPYRDREMNLRAFLNHMHPFLQKQQLNYGVYVVEQGGNAPFNRGLLLNIGFHHALKVSNYSCFAFHDVDMVPEMDNNLYRCSYQPIHLSVAQDRFHWGLPYRKYFGGAGLFSREQYIKMNGYPNRYFGWGGEDDDLFARLQDAGYHMARYSPDVGRYRNFNKGHYRAPLNTQRYQMVDGASDRMDKDGLNTMKYTLLAMKQKPLFTWIHVDLKKEDFSVT